MMAPECPMIHAARIGCPRCDADYADRSRRAAFDQLYTMRTLLLEARDLLWHTPDHNLAGRPGCPGCALEARIDAVARPWSSLRSV